MLRRENLILTAALLCLYYYQGFILGAAFISSFYIDPDCDVGLCPMSYLSALFFPLVGLISLLAGDRLGSIYGTKRAFEVGCLWWIIWTLVGAIYRRLKIVNICLRMSSIVGLEVLINAPNVSEFSAATVFEAVFTGGISMLGAYSGGQSLRKISSIASIPFVHSAVLSAVALYVVHNYVPDTRPKCQNSKVDWFGIIFGALGLSFMNLTPE
ncbi:hypothetical protein BGW36DRAFT_376943 [Talaromyces proteolyticus]|uniref:Major facilitator superfamily (MFS) profile domain-containing protein n=1 Tax=Talaromyces proteolyticus TaxID=1131652 RepID=A0AAD4KYK3_9EURO|nr:uncharacterized protein BGW36DRAFT_376943 [Talaromyces proteolyticus]KAH8698901.1 hypothetical protein BGW36DRAFT_376943 [Talaromyces proteolyticus]